MSRLEELIAEHCPDGVEYVPLGDVCEVNVLRDEINAIVGEING